VKKILLVEDDRTLSNTLSYNLQKEGYEVLRAFDGEEALSIALVHPPDLLILDIMLPKLSGLEVCRILRKKMNVPILILTAKVEETDKVVGLEMGADDYVTKPFSLRELLARVHALFRRTEMAVEKEDMVVTEGKLRLDLGRHQAFMAGLPLDLPLKEFELLALLIKNKGQTLSREQLVEKIWGYEYEGDTRTVDVHIRRLRAKIEQNPSCPLHILTVRGIGYRFG
jgi:DNA-binding response OmpR family regulator